MKKKKLSLVGKESQSILQYGIVPYCTIPVLSRFGCVTSGSLSMCTVSGIMKSGTVSYCTELERIGSVTTTFESCGSVGDG